MVQAFKNLMRHSRVLVATAVIALGMGTAGVVASTAVSTHGASAAACDKVNIIYCGHSGSTTSAKINSVKNYYNSNKSGHSASPTVKKDYTDIKTIYNWFGVSSSTVNGMSTSNTKIGTLYRNGDVKVDGKTVGTGAQVSARFSVPGAIKISGTNAYVRKTTSSFANDKVQVLVYFKGGVMQFAVMVDCGNVVKAKPVEQPKPSTGVCKSLSLAIVNRDKREVSAKVTGSTSNASIVGYKINWGDGKTSSTQSASHTYASYGKFTVTGSVYIKFANGTKKWVTADSCKKSIEFVKPKQTLACVKLEAIPASEKNQFRFVATSATTNGGTVSKYNFNLGDGTTVPVDSSSATAETLHTYAAAGEYTATVSVDGTVNGSNVSGVTDDACKVKITIAEDQKLACVNLTKESVEGVENSYLFKAVAQALNGATISSYTFNFGDGNTEVVETSDEAAEVTYTYKAAGDYNATVSVAGTVNDEEVTGVTDGECAVEITVAPEEEEECKPGIPVGDERCKEVLGKEVELPKTGAAGAVVLFSGISALGAFGHRLFTRRRF